MSDADLGSAFVPRLSPVILELMIETSGQLVSPEVHKILLQMLALEARFNWESWEEFLALHLALISCLHAHLKTGSVTLGELYPDATVFGASVLKKPIPMMSRSVAKLKEQMTPKRKVAILHARSVVLPGKSNPGFDVAMPHGDNEWLLIEAKYSENDATRTEAEDVLYKYDLIEARQNALPGMLLSSVCN